jgi:hypothetical protein
MLVGGGTILLTTEVLEVEHKPNIIGTIFFGDFFGYIVEI